MGRTREAGRMLGGLERQGCTCAKKCQNDGFDITWVLWVFSCYIYISPMVSYP